MPNKTKPNAAQHLQQHTESSSQISVAADAIESTLKVDVVPTYKPELRNGVGASQVFLPPIQAFKPNSAPQSVYAFLCEKFAHISAAEWQQRFVQGLVMRADGTSIGLDTAYMGNTHVFYYRALATEVEVPFAHQILFENEHLLVVDKPHFLTISPTGKYVQQTLLVRLKQQTGYADLTPIHRLDRETAGLVLFCKTASMRAAYQQLFATQQVQKTYHAIAPFSADLSLPCEVSLHLQKGEPFYTMQVRPDLAPNSQSRIELLAHNGLNAKYALMPTTGKQHQLRLHMAHLGIPILNDPLYPVVQHKPNDDFSQPLQLLAKRLALIDPITLQPLRFESQFELHL